MAHTVPVLVVDCSIDSIIFSCGSVARMLPFSQLSLKQKGCAALAYEPRGFQVVFAATINDTGRYTVFDREWSNVEGVTSGYSRETSRNCRHKGLRNASEILSPVEKPVIALSKLGLLLLCTHACTHSFQGYKHN